MMIKKLLGKTEGGIYRYYDNLKNIEKLQYRCMVLGKD